MTAHYSALCRSYRLGCGAGELCEPHLMRWVPTAAELRRYGKPHTDLRQERERAEHFGGWQGTESRALRSAVVGFDDVAADHFRFFTNNHSRQVAATLNTTMMLHGVDEAGSSLAVVGVGFASGASSGGRSTDDSGGTISLGRDCDADAGSVKPLGVEGCSFDGGFGRTI